MRLAAMVILTMLLSGCGNVQPTLAGGRPVSYWIAASRDPDAKVRKHAVFKLGNVGPADAAVLPALISTLKDPDAKVRCEAVLALLKCGAAAQEAVSELTEIQKKDRDAKVRSYAAKALEKIRGGP